MAKSTVKTRAIVLHTIKYGDSSLVVKMFTEDAGMQSFMVKGVYGKKSKMKAAMFQNMTLLEIVADVGNDSLGFVKELSLSHCYKTIPFDIKKTTILIFISELLSKSISESETDTELFNFIYDSMIWLDEATSSYANFPLFFSMQLSKYLGFFPNIDTYSEGLCFDLLGGNFKRWNNDIYQIDAELSKIFFLISRLSLLKDTYTDSAATRLYDLNSRRKLLDAIVTYYKLHADNVREIKSVEVLREVF